MVCGLTIYAVARMLILKLSISHFAINELLKLSQSFFKNELTILSLLLARHFHCHSSHMYPIAALIANAISSNPRIIPACLIGDRSENENLVI